MTDNENIDQELTADELGEVSGAGWSKRKIEYKRKKFNRILNRRGGIENVRKRWRNRIERFANRFGL